MNSLGNVMIFGDSYSTFEGWIPDGNAIYYGSNDIRNGVKAAELTWWHQLLEKTGSNLILNDSWSGSTICDTGYNGYCRVSSFVGRLKKYEQQDFYSKNNINTFLIFGGTNDSWANSPIGKQIYSDFTEEDLKSTLPALSFVISSLKNLVANARIIVIINCDIKTEITNGYTEICKKYDTQYVLLHDIDKINGHPTALGMKQISEQIEEIL